MKQVCGLYLLVFLSIIGLSGSAFACGGSSPKKIVLANSPFFVNEFTITPSQFIFKDARGRDAWMTCNNSIPRHEFRTRFYDLHPEYDADEIAAGHKYRMQDAYELYQTDIANNQVNGFFVNVAADSPTQAGCRQMTSPISRNVENRCTNFIGRDQSMVDSDETPQRTSMRFFEHSRALSVLQGVGVRNIPYPSSVMSFSSSDNQKQLLVVCNTSRAVKGRSVGPDYVPPPQLDSIQDEVTVIMVNGGQEVGRVTTLTSVSPRFRGGAGGDVAATFDMASTSQREIRFPGCGGAGVETGGSGSGGAAQ